MEIMRKQITGETQNGDNEEANNRRNREVFLLLFASSLSPFSVSPVINFQ
jgi:hypothetical protein